MSLHFLFSEEERPMLTHTGTKNMETDRLLLRPFVPEDADAMYRNWASSEEVTRFLTWPVHANPDITKQVLDSWCRNYANRDYYQWAIVPKALGEPIGSISVVRIEGACAEVGYCIGTPWWHKGYTSEALDAVLAHLFDRVGFDRVEAEHDVCNPHSGGVMAKCGMVCEGTFPQSGQNNQGSCDLRRYALAKEAWQCTT